MMEWRATTLKITIRILQERREKKLLATENRACRFHGVDHVLPRSLPSRPLLPLMSPLTQEGADALTLYIPLDQE